MTLTNWLAATIELYGDAAINSDDSLPLLVEAARAWHYAGRPHPDIWAALSRNERVALAVAGKEIAEGAEPSEADALLEDGLAATVEVLSG